MVKHLTRDNGKNHLELFQKAVKGNIQRLTLDQNSHLYLNEDGINLDLPRNLHATALVEYFYQGTRQAFPDGWALGTMIVCFEEFSKPDILLRSKSGYKNNVELLRSLSN